MTSIGLISDTHSFWDATIPEYFKVCDEIWHAGDIGDLKIMEQLNEIAPTKAVYGNIDDQSIVERYPEDLIEEIEGIRIFMTHIGGKPPQYNKRVKARINELNPDLFICGHSHILKVMKDPKRNTLYMNPGAAGQQGFHRMRTIMRFKVSEGQIIEPEVIELGKRGKIN